jgi:hypothetical protein
MTPSDLTRLDAQLHRLHLHYIQGHYQALATKAAEQQYGLAPVSWRVESLGSGYLV